MKWIYGRPTTSWRISCSPTFPTTSPWNFYRDWQIFAGHKILFQVMISELTFITWKHHKQLSQHWPNQKVTLWWIEDEKPCFKVAFRDNLPRRTPGKLNGLTSCNVLLKLGFPFENCPTMHVLEYNRMNRLQPLVLKPKITSTESMTSFMRSYLDEKPYRVPGETGYIKQK